MTTLVKEKFMWLWKSFILIDKPQYREKIDYRIFRAIRRTGL